MRSRIISESKRIFNPKNLNKMKKKFFFVGALLVMAATTAWISIRSNDDNMSLLMRNVEAIAQQEGMVVRAERKSSHSESYVESVTDSSGAVMRYLTTVTYYECFGEGEVICVSGVVVNRVPCDGYYC